MYGSPEWYDEPQESLSLSPATKKRHHDELEKDLDEITTDSDFMFGPQGKTPSELESLLDAKIAENKDLFP